MSSGGVASVVTITAIITLVKHCGSSSPLARPVAAIIRATSPLEIMPAPIMSEERVLNPVSRACDFHSFYPKKHVKRQGEACVTGSS